MFKESYKHVVASIQIIYDEYDINFISDNFWCEQLKRFTMQILNY